VSGIEADFPAHHLKSNSFSLFLLLLVVHMQVMLNTAPVVRAVLAEACLDYD
jgi:hypothetical protein